MYRQAHMDTHTPRLPDIPLSRLIHIVVKHRKLRVIIRKTVGEGLQEMAESLLLLLPNQHSTIAPDDAEQEKTLHVYLTEHFSCLSVSLL